MNCYPIINQVRRTPVLHSPSKTNKYSFYCLYMYIKQTAKKGSPFPPPPFFPAVCGIFRTEPNEKYFNVKITEKAGEKGKNVSRLPRLCGPWSSFHFNSLSQLEDGNFLRKTKRIPRSQTIRDWLQLGVSEICANNYVLQRTRTKTRSSLLDLDSGWPAIRLSVCIFSLIFVN